MRLQLIWPGKTKNAHLRALSEDYLTRLSHFARCEVTELRVSAASTTAAGIDRESRRISDALSNDGISVLLDPKGAELSSPQLAKQIQQWENGGTKTVAFVVGGPDGVSEDLAAKVDMRWSLSRLTFTHEIARVILVEQLYRAYAIIHKLPYVK